MNKVVYDLLLKLEQCDDRHNRCDYLMEHDEITYLLEHIEEKNKEIERLTAESTEWESKCYKYQDIIYELEKYLYEHSQVDFDCNDNIVHEQLALSMAYEYLEELKENKDIELDMLKALNTDLDDDVEMG